MTALYEGSSLREERFTEFSQARLASTPPR